jgi:hypothetical protein
MNMQEILHGKKKGRLRIVSSESDKNKGTFIVKILNRKNSTWQGTVTWVEQRKKQKFRSALELIRLLDSTQSDDTEEWKKE